MRLRSDVPLLCVELDTVRTIDTRSAENLFGLWTVFSKCADAMEDGKRLENLSWRLWNRETFCCAPGHSTLSSPRCKLARSTLHSVQPSSSVPDLVPSSVDSDSSDEAHSPSVSRSAATSARATFQRRDVAQSPGRGREKHITPVDLEKFVASIKEAKPLEPLSPLPPTLAPRSPAPVTTRTENTTPRPPTPARMIPESSASTVGTVADTDVSNMSPPVGSDTSTTATDLSSHSVVRGFELGRISSSYRSKTQLAHTPTPILKAAPPAKTEQGKKKGATFTIGGGSSDEEVESSLETHMRVDSRDQPSDSSRRPAITKKTTSFKDEVTTIHRRPCPTSSAIESEDEDAVSESAIEDDEDDDDEWEDSSDVGEASADEKSPTFERVESAVNLTSRRSLLTMQMHEPQRATAFQNLASRSTPALRRSRTSSPSGPSVAASPPEPVPEVPGAQTTRSRPIIMTTSNTHTLPHPPALSPRTTRRNMLSTELTESLRKNLLWERQQKNSTSNAAALKRRHTSHDVKNLSQFPSEPNVGRLATVREASKAVSSWNHYFDNGLQEYHEKGW